MDKSFEGLLISVLLHIVLVVLYFNAPSIPSSESPTEITIVDGPPRRGRVVENMEKAKEEPKDLKDTADFLSQFTRRVKKQLVAKNLGPERNLQPTDIPLNSREPTKRKADSTSEEDPDSLGRKAPIGLSAHNLMAMGQSSFPVPVPGVQGSNITSLNSDKDLYAAFWNRVSPEITNRWYPSVRRFTGSRTEAQMITLSRRDRVTQFEVAVNSEGEYVSSLIARSSGDPELDRLNVETVVSALPFPNPPRGMIEEDGLIHLRFAFTLYFRPPFGQATN